MHPADIQAKLKKKGITQHSIALELGVSEMHVSGVIHYPKARPSDRVFRAIAAKIGMDHREVFPEYYLNKKTKRRTPTD